MRLIIKSIFEKCFENLFGFIISIILSSLVISSASYLLFDARSELQRISKSEPNYEKIISESKFFNEMWEINNSGWFSPSFDNMGKLRVLINGLGKIKCSSTFNRSVEKISTTFFSESISQLSIQRAKIAGFYFTNEKLKKQQSSLIEFHDTLIATIQELLEMVKNWNKENVNVRNKHWESVYMPMLKSVQASTSNSITFQQIIEESELQLREMEKALKFNQTERNMCWTRIYLSIIGLIVGIAAIIVIIWKGYKYIEK
jgi:hypothetical protein